jgi:rubrerythrin
MLCYIPFNRPPEDERTVEMTIDEAIKTALQYEGRVCAIYHDAMDRSQDPIGKKVFKTLNEEEAGHVRYLMERLEEWERAGKINARELSTTIPTAKKIKAAAKSLQGKVASPMPEGELKLLRRALEIEAETSDFYRKMVRDLPAEEKALFERFVEIEEGHKAIVQAEIDYVTGMGFWFDIAEFRLEAG